MSSKSKTTAATQYLAEVGLGTVNRAMTQDLNKGISFIQYNSLNSPISMAIDNRQNTRGSIDVCRSDRAGRTTV